MDYCVNVVDRSIEEKRRLLETTDANPTNQRKIQGALYAEEVKVCAVSCYSRGPSLQLNASTLPLSHNAQRDQVHGELAVEKIVRNRSLNGTCHCAKRDHFLKQSTDHRPPQHFSLDVDILNPL